jgi:hypothetical protein
MADDEARINWSTATVSDGKLSVELEGEQPKGWKGVFETTVKLLGQGEWGSIGVKKGTVTVADLAPGSEDKLRHHLEAIVEQANATLRPDEPDGEGDGADEPEGPDAEMAARFRSFADASGDDVDGSE